MKLFVFLIAVLALLLALVAGKVASWQNAAEGYGDKP